ncbi:MAG TPA: N-acetylmuramoyl-L-alanine amidase [Candidatus Omnitrophota bacterium]|nr:N-acetylmuramoyl-L-alanine amidase [Candidatus Omnitrophota bacterium]HRZ15505.1 N-acetylmuramoyl-L-alanine amidase [Candidatus Omnitrophota bacterium]
MKKILLGILLLAAALTLSSCVTAPIQPIPPQPVPSRPVVRGDICHVVAPGETIWRISKMYDVPMESIVRANNLKDATQLEKGQRLAVPNAAPIVPVVTLYPSAKWKYIIIHHSATDEGNSYAFDNSHRSKGWNSVGYHFVIDNGTQSKQDGQIEAGPRWIKQQDGSHCRAGNMNTKAIGICLVGNFNKSHVSSKQMDSLIYVVNRLRHYYKIPADRIMGHGQVAGATTACPGKLFPWSEFKSRVRQGS